MTRVTTASALALATLAGPALADVTPGQVWQDLESYLQSFGYEVAANETMSGDTLTVTDFSFTFPVPEEDLVFTVTLPDLTYTDNGDGTVGMTIPAESNILVVGGPAGEPPEATIVMTLEQQDFAVTVSGDENATSYAYGAERMAMRLADIIATDEDVPDDVLKASMEMGPMSGTSTLLRADGMQTISQTMDFGKVSYEFAFDDPDSDDLGEVRATLNAVTGEGDLVLPMDADFADPTAVFAAGLAVDSVLAHGGGSTEFTVNDSGDLVSGKFSSEGGEIGVSVSSESMVYTISALAQSIEMMVPDLPFPVMADIGEMGFSFEAPLQPSETPQPAGLSVLLAEFRMADSLWNIFDPGQMLPRDPATISANIEAQVTPFISIIDPEQTAAMEATGGVPGELNELTLSDLVVRAVGAEILGEGAFVFDNSDLESFDGMPRPEGAVTFQVSGINGLLDTLISMGIVGDQDAMGARMMMGMFMVPGAEPDTASSVIEINAQGHILANGQRIQ
jgi:hypothetical protein